jgi:NitT/TauT family transport system substrate-binding protein
VTRSRLVPVIAAVLGVALLATACDSGATPSPASAAPTDSGLASAPPSAAASDATDATDTPESSPTTPTTVTKLTVGLGYIPSVQFAQFYLAQQAGYYRDAGLEVTFENKIDPDLIRLVGQGAIDIGIADGTSVIPAVQQGIPVRYVTAIYGQFPNIVFAKASGPIKTAADLKGKKIGTPGKFGSSWIMLQALLQSADLTTADVDIQLYPDFGQAAALQQGAVDAATGFDNNEPIVLGLAGTPTTVLTVDSIVPLPGNGLIAGVDTIAKKHDALVAFVGATLRAMADITADPEMGVSAAVAVVPDLGKDKPTQLAILNATIDAWSSDYTTANGLGAIDLAAWGQTVIFMAGLPGSGVTAPGPSVDQLVDSSLLAP